LELIPYRVLLPPGHPTRRPDRLLWSFFSLQRPPSDEPRHEPACRVRPWFRSQVFSPSQRFPSKSEVCGLVSCRYRSWDSTLQSLPLAGDRLPLSRQPGSLAVIHWRGTRSSPWSCHSPFHRLPRSRAVAWFPGRAMGFLSPQRVRIPFALEHESKSSHLRASFTYFEASLPPASPFAVSSGLPSLTGRYSLGLLPL
jgi:hypothetical protein